MRRILLFVFFITLMPGTAVASSADVIDHGPFEELLKKYVNQRGMVNYDGLRTHEEDLAKLDRYVRALGEASVSGKSRPAQLAFYLNAYNALVIRHVITKHPMRNVMDDRGFFRRDTHKVAGTEMTLDHLEHQLIRPRFKEPRIHFVLVCAAMSCPRLLRQAFTAANVERLMEAAAKEFIPASTKIEGKRVVASQLFNWFADDFVEGEGSVGAYLARYLPEHRELLTSEEVEITFSEYDWSLNAQ